MTSRPVCKSELYPSLLPRSKHTTQVFPWYRIKAWNRAILVTMARVHAHCTHLHSSIWKKKRMCVVRLDEGSVTSGGWTSGMRAEPVSMSQVWLLTTVSTLSFFPPPLSLSLLQILSPRATSPSWILWFRIVPRDLEHHGVEGTVGQIRGIESSYSVKIQNEGRPVQMWDVSGNIGRVYKLTWRI